MAFWHLFNIKTFLAAGEMRLRAVFHPSRHNKNDIFNGMVLSIGRGVDNVELSVVFGMDGFWCILHHRVLVR